MKVCDFPHLCMLIPSDLSGVPQLSLGAKANLAISADYVCETFINRSGLTLF